MVRLVNNTESSFVFSTVLDRNGNNLVLHPDSDLVMEGYEYRELDHDDIGRWVERGWVTVDYDYNPDSEPSPPADPTPPNPDGDEDPTPPNPDGDEDPTPPNPDGDEDSD